MLYLILAVAASTSIIVLFKLFGRYGINTFYAIIINYIVATSFGFLTESGGYSIVEIPSKSWFYLAIIKGLFFIVGFNLFALSARRAGVALTGMATRMSLIVAVSAGLIVFGDNPGALRIIGIITGILAFVFTFTGKNNSGIDGKYLLLPLVLLLAQGASDLLMKVAQHYYIEGDFRQFLSTVFMSALIFGLLYLFITRNKLQKLTYRELLAGLVLGLTNWYSGYFLLLSLDVFDVSFVIPVINVSVVLGASLIGYFLFKEKLDRLKWVGVFLAMLSILLMLR